MTQHSNPCPDVAVTEEIKKYFDSRNQLGWHKYGVTMDRQDLNGSEWCTHLIDELGDAMQYAWKLREQLNDKPSNVEIKRNSDYVKLDILKTYDDLNIDEIVYFSDEEEDMHLAVICGFVNDPEDGDLVILQLGYNWIGVSMSTLYTTY